MVRGKALECEGFRTFETLVQWENGCHVLQKKRFRLRNWMKASVNSSPSERKVVAFSRKFLPCHHLMAEPLPQSLKTQHQRRLKCEWYALAEARGFQKVHLPIVERKGKVHKVKIDENVKRGVRINIKDPTFESQIFQLGDRMFC